MSTSDQLQQPGGEGSNLDLMAILARSERAYGKVLDQFIDADGASASIREHFNYDVPALIGAVQRLTAELVAPAVARAMPADTTATGAITRALDLSDDWDADERAAFVGFVCGQAPELVEGFSREYLEAVRRLYGVVRGEQDVPQPVDGVGSELEGGDSRG